MLIWDLYKIWTVPGQLFFKKLIAYCQWLKMLCFYKFLNISAMKLDISSWYASFIIFNSVQTIEDSVELLYSGASDPHAAKIIESDHQLQMIASEATVQLHRVQYFLFHLTTSVQIISHLFIMSLSVWFSCSHLNCTSLFNICMLTWLYWIKSRFDYKM